jgi:hypothetical protein
MSPRHAHLPISPTTLIRMSRKPSASPASTLAPSQRASPPSSFSTPSVRHLAQYLFHIPTDHSIHLACALTFLFLLATLYALARRNAAPRRGASCGTIVLGLLAALLTTVIFLVDVILVAVVRSHIRKDTNGLVSLGWGNAVWMTLGATIALWLALVSACLGVFRGRKRR